MFHLCLSLYHHLEATGCVGLFAVLTVSYYVMTSKVTAKASILFTTTCAFGMLISLLQNIGIIGTMTVEFPLGIKGFFSFMSIFVLDLESFGFACVAGANSAFRYTISVLLFPIAIGWFSLNFGAARPCCSSLKSIINISCNCTRYPMNRNLIVWPVTKIKKSFINIFYPRHEIFWKRTFCYQNAVLPGEPAFSKACVG